VCSDIRKDVGHGITHLRMQLCDSVGLVKIVDTPSAPAV